jgi:hypothetical protein
LSFVLCTCLAVSKLKRYAVSSRFNRSTRGI